MDHPTDRDDRALARQQPEQMTYARAGVNIDAGNDFVERIRNAVASTRRPGADAQIGGFGGEVDLSHCGVPDGPILVGAIDGVGTKLMIAQAMGQHHTVGIDLVAMNVNDLIVQGAEPVMFLDYYACSKLDPASAAVFVEGVAEGCRQAGCALVGGETAEMPGLYRNGDFDAAGAAVGLVTRANRLPRLDLMAVGDVLLGLGSSGVHSNGFTLVRRIVSDAGLAYTDPAPWDPENSVGDALLAPTRIYVRQLLPLVRKKLVKGLAHVTGGGLVENVPRMLPPHLGCELDIRLWKVPAVFAWLRTAGNVAAAEMCRTFNNGIGMVLAVDPGHVDAVVSELESEVFRIGAVVEHTGERCRLLGLEEVYRP